MIIVADRRVQRSTTNQIDPTATLREALDAFPWVPGTPTSIVADVSDALYVEASTRGHAPAAHWRSRIASELVRHRAEALADGLVKAESYYAKALVAEDLSLVEVMLSRAQRDLIEVIGGLVCIASEDDTGAADDLRSIIDRLAGIWSNVDASHDELRRAGIVAPRAARDEAGGSDRSEAAE